MKQNSLIGVFHPTNLVLDTTPHLITTITPVDSNQALEAFLYHLTTHLRQIQHTAHSSEYDSSEFIPFFVWQSESVRRLLPPAMFGDEVAIWVSTTFFGGKCTVLFSRRPTRSSENDARGPALSTKTRHMYNRYHGARRQC